MRVVSGVLALAVSLWIAGNLMAADNGKGPAGKGRPAWSGPFSFLSGLDLTADQKAKLEALNKEYQPKLTDASKAVESILTPEQKKAREAARKVAQRVIEEVRKACQKAVEEAVQLTPEQKAKVEEVKKQNSATYKEFRAKVMDVLTPEQQEQLKKKWGHRGEAKKHKPDAPKPAAPKPEAPKPEASN